jgi:hypothetical protein
LDDSRHFPIATSLGLHVLGACSPHGDPRDIPTIVAGIAKRVAGESPEPNRLLFDQFSKFVESWLLDNLVPLDPCTGLSVEEWLSHSNYTPTRRRQILERYKRMRSDCIHPSQRKTQIVKSFVKHESYLSFKHVRGIYARLDDIKICIGPYIKAIEQVVYSNHHFIKHVPVADRARVLDEDLRLCEILIASDYTAFEKHFTSLTYIIEFKLYHYMLSRVPQAKWICELMWAVFTGINVCKFKTLTAHIPAGRMSGEMNTSLGNGFVNLMLFLFLNYSKGNVEPKAKVEGDDLIGGYSGKELTSEDYLSLGFTIKVERPISIHEASFCGLIYDPVDLVSIPDPHKVLLNVGWTSDRYYGSTTKTRLQLLRAKGLSLLHQYPGAPIIQSLAKYIIRCTDGMRYKFPGEWTNWQIKHFDPKPVEKPVGFRTRMLMERKFGYSLSEQLSIEAYFDSCKEIKPINHWSIYDHCSSDQKEYYSRFVSGRLPDPRRPWILTSSLTTEMKMNQVKLLTSNVSLVKRFNSQPVDSEFVL